VQRRRHVKPYRRNPSGPMTDGEKLALAGVGVAGFIAILAYASKSSASTGPTPTAPATPAATGLTAQEISDAQGAVPPFVPGT
jgi:hypothetical protein